MGNLLVYQSLWATERREPGRNELSIEARFNEVSAAGFDGMSIDLGAISLEQAGGIVSQFARTGLRGLVTAFPTSIEDLTPAINLAKDIGAPFVIVVGQIMPITVEDMIPAIHGWLSVAKRERFRIQFETHRASITNDLFSTLQLLDAIPEIRLSADLSHYVLDRELELPIDNRMMCFFDKILSRADSIQGRIGTGQHIQVPIHFSHNRLWCEQFERWWRAGMLAWKMNSSLENDFVFLCELGPRDYAFVDANGMELSDRNEEAIYLMQLARRMWAES